MLTIPTTEPAAIQAGDTIQWLRTVPGYSAADGWVLAYRLINATANTSIISTAQGDDHLVSISAATSAGYAAGDYTWTAHVTRNTDRYTIAQGSTTIRPDLAAQVAGFDARGPAQKALSDLRTRIAIAEREAARETAAQRLAAGQPAARRIQVRF